MADYKRAKEKMTEDALETGIVRIKGKSAVYMDPVRVLSAAYASHVVKSDAYYSRAFFTSASVLTPTPAPTAKEEESGVSNKRKRKRKVYNLNEKEALAESRHQDVRLNILEAHEAFQASVAPSVREYVTFHNTKDIICASDEANSASNISKGEAELNFVEIAALWQAPLYELSFTENGITGQVGREEVENVRTTTLFNTVIENSSRESAVVQCSGCKYLLPNLCKFLISDISEVHRLVSGVSDEGFNLMVIDPPWENKSVHRRALYPTLPNKHLLSLPVKQLAHEDGALVALWITNREKLRQFVEKELFPAWGVTLTAVWYWLKVTAEGAMVSPLDLAHHKPYECLILGYLPSKAAATADGKHCIEQPILPDKFVIITIPGDHSRKPPLKSLLSAYIPGQRPEKGLELFARELTDGWTSWGNEPLRFQHLKYFLKKEEPC